MPGPADLAAMRSTLGDLGLGDVALQEFGGPSNILIRVQRQEGGEQAQLAAVEKVKAALAERFGPDISYRRVESVGPKVSSDLLWAGTQASVYAVIAIVIYIWFRFEWQFGVGALLTLFHDVAMIFGFFALTQLQVDLNIVAAFLAIVGYSLNDTVVIYDRIRENLRKYRKMEIVELLNFSLNETLSRTIVTSLSIMLALTVLLILGPEVLFGLTVAILLGTFIGTYSSIYISAPALVWLGLKPDSFLRGEEEKDDRTAVHPA
jgi:preprotein translocase subunit SecF